MACRWTRWRPFPDPASGGLLVAPFGPGVYELRNRRTAEMVLFGIGRNVAMRMTSLLPAEAGGRGRRNNSGKRRYVLEHLPDIEYRTLPCLTRAEAAEAERRLRRGRTPYLFST